MIISRTPFRLSFFGGGTDYPTWFQEHGGAVLATAIDKYCYINCRYLPPFFDHTYRVVYSKIENCVRIEDIAHPAVRETLRFLDFTRGVEIHHDGDLPARSGIGSSSSFTVGLLNALYALQGRIASKKQLASESIHIEQDLIKETVGSQDQITAAYGGFNHVVFSQNGEFSIIPITLSPQRIRELNDHLMLFFTGIVRTSSNIADTIVENMSARKQQLRITHDLVAEAISILNSERDIVEFGRLLDEAWKIKRTFSPLVSCEKVDSLYDKAIAAGAVGGKITGAGGGGFLVLFAPPDVQSRIRSELSDLIYVPFRFEMAGSQIIFFDYENDYHDHEWVRANRLTAPFQDSAPIPS
jgi:D-glycero-alpha-D-manno-heptose-7-phosphate kinase